jgi:acetoin utilization protein AcuC
VTLRVYGGEQLGAYGFPHGHPFGPDRFTAFWRELQARGLDRKVEIGAPLACDARTLALFHDPAYIERVQAQSRSGEGYLDYGDTPAFPGVFEAASTVVGSVLDAARWMLEGEERRAFVPIGGLHHARREGAAGFCVFNDIGVTIEWLRTRGVRRIAYVDIDAHHGDGVFYGFEDDPDLIFADLHEDGHFLYPGTGDASETGRGSAKGTKLNIPLAPGADDAVFQRHWPRVEAFVRAGKPEFVILQAGADSVADDPLTHLRLTPAAHAHAAAQLKAVAREQCAGRVLALGGGGYDRANLANAWCAVVEALLD